jgi:hypothetical protein
MEASFWRAGVVVSFVAIFAAGLALPNATLAQAQKAEDRAIQAFLDSPEVASKTASMKARANYEDREPVAVQLSESCGAAGCYYDFLVNLLLSPRGEINPQAHSISAMVKVSPRGGATVTLINLTRAPFFDACGPERPAAD